MHGIRQSGYRTPSDPIQVASAQTLENSRQIPEGDLVMIDECHSQRKFIMERR